MKDANCWGWFKNFKATEFRCLCGKCEIPWTKMDCSLIYALQAIRNHLGKAVIITSGHRCIAYNDSLEGSIKNSDHIKGKAADFKYTGSNNKEDRYNLMLMIRELPNVNYTYCDGYYMTKSKINKNYSAPWMGSSIHISVN